VTPCDLMLLAKLKYDRVHLSYPNIPEKVELQLPKYVELNAQTRVRGSESLKHRQFECGRLTTSLCLHSHIDPTVHNFCSTVV